MAPVGCQRDDFLFEKKPSSKATYLINLFLHIHKSRINHPLLIILRNSHRFIEYMARLDQFVAPLVQIRRSFIAVIVTKDSDGGVGDLEPAAVLEVL